MDVMDAMDDGVVEMAGLPVVTSSGQLRESKRIAAEETMAGPQAVLSSKGSFGSRKQPKLKPVLSRELSIDDVIVEPGTVLTVEQMFRVLDADDSGGLDMIELSRFVELLGVPTSEDQVHRMLESKLKTKLLAGEEPELDFEGFKEFVDPILEEVRESEMVAAEEEARAGTRPNGLPAGAFEASSLGFLALENPARLAAIKLVSMSAFDYVVLGLIGCNSVLMALEDPLRPENNPEWMTAAELSFVRSVGPLLVLALVSLPLLQSWRACEKLTPDWSAEYLVHDRDVLEDLRLGPGQRPAHVSTVAVEYSRRRCRAD
jgi:hypothetical protein